MINNETPEQIYKRYERKAWETGLPSLRELKPLIIELHNELVAGFERQLTVLKDANESGDKLVMELRKELEEANVKNQKMRKELDSIYNSPDERQESY